MKKTGSRRRVSSGVCLVSCKVFLTCVLFSAVAQLYAIPPRLHVDGNKVKDPNGTIVTLRGVSFVDLGSQEVWYGGATALIDRITDLNDSNGNSPGWYTKIIRIPVYPPDDHAWPYEFDPNNPAAPANETLYNLLRTVVDYCGEKDVYVAIDWHGLTNTYDLIAQTNAFWTYMAPRFKDDTHVIYELFNEPINNIGSDSANWTSVKTDMEAWIDIVRASAPDTLIFVGTPRWCQIIGPTAADPVSDPNVVYITHIYPYHWLSGNQYYRNSITAAAAAHPVILGEWGFEPAASSAQQHLIGTISNYGQPLKEFVEGIEIGSIAWVASYNWEPPMFADDWTLLCGEGEMGGFAKDWLFEASGIEQTINLTIKKCTVTAGKTQGQDNFTASGTLSSSPFGLNAVTKIDVNIISLADGNSIYPESIDFDYDTDVVKNKYSYTIPRGQADGIASLKMDFARKTFAITAKKIDFTGLACPLRLKFTMGNYTLTGDANEAIVNGKKASIPTRLMRLYKDTLVVTKAKGRHSTTAASDSLSITGEIAVEDMDVDANEPNLVNKDVVLTWGDQNGTPTKTLTIPGNANPVLASFKASKKGHLYKCSKINPAEDPTSTITAQFDLDKCTFTVSLSKADSVFVGPADPNFSVSFDTPNGEFYQAVDVNRITGRSY
jgi:hypothetical protein